MHPAQVATWKKDLLERVPEIFERKNAAKDKDVEREFEQFQCKVGQLTMEEDFLKKNLFSWGSPAEGGASGQG